MNDHVAEIIDRLHSLGDKEIAAHSRRFFKTGKGQYGEGDLFLGIRVPVLRKCARHYRDIAQGSALEILKSPFHEARMLALLILVAKYSAASTNAGQKEIYNAYLENTAFINNWDLVDCSAEHIVGAYLFARDRGPLYRLVRSRNMWERRIAVMSTFHLIKKEDFAETIALAKLLLQDKEDLIHKAAGWMLRETGKRRLWILEDFLLEYYKLMPRTMLRYAIERFPENERQEYLQGAK